MGNKNLRYCLLAFSLIAGMGCQFFSATDRPVKIINTPAPVLSTATILPPTATITPKPEAVADLSWAVVQVLDLPSNLNPKELPSSMISIGSFEMLGEEFLHQQPFLVFHDGGLVTGFTVHLVDQKERQKFLDLAASTTYDSSRMGVFLDKFMSGGQATLNSKDDSLEDVGDFQETYTLQYVWKYNSASRKNLEVIFFTRGDIGVFITNQYFPGYSGHKILTVIARSLDKRIATVVQSGIPLQDPHQSVADNADLSWLTPRNSDAGFTPGMQQIPLDELGLDEPEIGGITYDNLFAFQDSSGPKILVGYNFVLNSLDEIGIFDVLVSQSEDLLEDFATSVGGENMRDYYQLQQLEGAGDIHNGLSLTADLDGQPYEFTIVLFRNDLIGNLLFVVQPPTPREFHFQDRLYDGIVNVRSIAFNIGYYMDFLFLYNLPSGAESPTPGPGILQQNG